MASSSGGGLKGMIRRIKLQEDLIIAPKVERFLMSNPDWTVSEENAERLKHLVMKQDRDRTESFSGSAAGSCKRAQIFGFKGVKQRSYVDTALLQVFKNGTWVHLRWQMMLLEAGVLDDIEVVIPHPNDWRLKGSMDGVGEDPIHGEFMFELKGWSANVDEPVPYHVEQIHRYMLGADLSLCSLVYESKTNQTHREFLVKWDHAVGTKVIDELEELNLHVVDERVPEMLSGCKQMKGDTFNKCPYRNVCHDIGEWSDMDEHCG